MEEADFSFEQQWADAFDQAEQTPPAHVWVAIDGQLANATAKEYKKRLVIYQWVAAACVFLLMVFGLGYWSHDYRNTTQPTQNAHQVTTPAEYNRVRSSTNSLAETKEESPQPLENVTTKKGNKSSLTPLDQPALTLPATNDPNYEVKAGLRSRKQTYELFLAEISIEHLSPDDFRLTASAIPDFLYGVPNTAYIIDQKHAELWAGVSMSSGSFDPSFHSGSSSSASLMSDQSMEFVSQSSAKSLNNSQLQYDPGYAISGGINVGTKLKNRLIFSTGLHYQAFNTADAQTSVVSDGHEFYALTRNSNDQALNEATENSVLNFESTEASLSNEYRYMSVPIKAGYVILDRRFNIVLNTGLSSNFLLDAQLVNKDSDQKLSNDLNTRAEYESIYFNFLTSVEFGYVVWHKYQITLEPNYNQALTNFTNSNNESQGKPQNIGVAFGLKYNF
ncbi:hypothetical protein N6H18_07475 [Reichenbachiella agarivorans]|uniref:Outer membrane protein beta-barrel domain-containing protein n=1 Tax=Reichenbachiella agarivorans TaxID=2979464 RepID=A0ABY6CTE2_9BACT|nr:hypothetical protein [Reichenbachiella agarivorans]UXP33787.1 hypothetical protein N6H18_07475 [Reichenbachiella agarivorans]